MKNSTISTEPVLQPTALEALRGNLAKLLAESATIEREAASAGDEIGRLARETAEAEHAILHGRGDYAALTGAREREEAARARDVRLRDEIASRREVIVKLNAAIELEEGRLSREVAQQARRQLCELLAPLVETSLRVLNGLGGIHINATAAVDEWSRSFQDRSGGSRFIAAMAAMAMRAILAGDRDFMMDVIRDLETAAPDLVSPAMIVYLRDSFFLENEKARRRASVVDSKAASARMLLDRAKENEGIHMLFIQQR